MSTAIALQDMRPNSKLDANTIRHRTISTNDPKSSPEDEWLSTPHDTDSTALPLDSHPFAPTHTYWLSPHGTLAREIKILDLTADMDVPYTGLTSSYKTSVKKTLKDHSFTPVFTCHRDHWLGLRYTIKDVQSREVAQWKHPWHSAGEATLTFPPDSPHAEHPVGLKNRVWGLRTEAFTLNSQLYFWQMDRLWHAQTMTLYKVLGSGKTQKKVEVGKYAQKWWGGFVTGGTFVVNEREMDGLVACLTLCVVLKKKRQRAAERGGGGGGGGDGGGG